jgi:hypothetical protein
MRTSPASNTSIQRCRILGLLTVSFLAGLSGQAAGKKIQAPWHPDAPIITYWAGPQITDTSARQMKAGGFNLIWCQEAELDMAARHGLGALLQSRFLSPSSLDSPLQQAELDALIARVCHHPSLRGYFLTDEPSASLFAKLGKIVAHVRERDPAHFVYINLFPTYANNEQLGTVGPVVAAYHEHLRQYLETVKPALISYDHYQFAINGDNDQYFLNLSLIRQAALESGLPFLNIVQACTWTPSMRVPDTNEVRYLISTTAAYGALGISYYVYCHPNHLGGIAFADGTPTPLYQALRLYNREFAAIAKELMPLKSLAVYQTAMNERGCEPIPANAPFRIASSTAQASKRGFLLGYFGKHQKPTYVMVVNLDYRADATTTLLAPRNLQIFNTLSANWSKVKSPRAELRFAPGEGRLLRVR